jgi:hypothetical protein
LEGVAQLSRANQPNAAKDGAEKAHPKHLIKHGCFLHSKQSLLVRAGEPVRGEVDEQYVHAYKYGVVRDPTKLSQGV